ncbi:MAG: BufA1 family periplasmic bufferin-type metallophore [Burkholderiales bacterium]
MSSLLIHAAENTTTIVHSALAGALALGMLSNASAEAAKHAGEEQCAGIVKAGMNDCTTIVTWKWTRREWSETHRI